MREPNQQEGQRATKRTRVDQAQPEQQQSLEPLKWSQKSCFQPLPLNIHPSVRDVSILHLERNNKNKQSAWEVHLPQDEKGDMFEFYIEELTAVKSWTKRPAKHNSCQTVS